MQYLLGVGVIAKRLHPDSVLGCVAWQAAQPPEVRLRGIGRDFAGLRDHHPQVAGIGVPGSGDPAGYAALRAAIAQPNLHGNHAGQEAGGGDRAEEGAEHRGLQ